MKRLSLITFAVLACLSLSACGTNSKNAKRESEASSLKVANSKLRKKAKAQSRKKQHTNKQSSNSSASSSANQSSQQQGQQTQQSTQQRVNNADDAVAAARAKYGDDGGSVHWGYMIDASTGQPIRNADGSYFVKGTDNQSMSGTRYSVNVYPDGSTTNN